jgi:F-type H+-transporting ATPase subunit b
MTALAALPRPPLAASGSWLITPDVGLMFWTLVVFGISFVILKLWVYPLIQAAIDRRQAAITESIDAAERQRAEAEAVLVQYHARLEEARQQAEEILARARRTAEEHEREAVATARLRREELLEQTKSDIEGETRRAIDDIREAVATLTILATEKVTRQALTEKDQRRLVEEALGGLDFTTLQGREN